MKTRVEKVRVIDDLKVEFILTRWELAKLVEDSYLSSDDIYTGTNVEKSDIHMNDPETITINSMIDDLSYIFVGRNDGKIMRGSALFWETRKTFADIEEYSTGGLPGSPVGGFLSLNNTTIRL